MGQGQSYEMKTVRGYDFFESASVLQKAIRRNNVKLAGYFAHELYASGYCLYVWKRLLTVSAEDVAGFATQEIFSLFWSWELINKGNKDRVKKGRIFMSKAVVLLCEAMKSRDSDHMQCLMYDKNEGISKEEIDEAIHSYHDVNQVVEVPEWAYDLHTKKGKTMGKTKEEFFRDEQEALTPVQIGLFDNLVP